MNTSALIILLEEIQSFAGRCLARLKSEESLKVVFGQFDLDRTQAELLKILEAHGYSFDTQTPSTVTVRRQESPASSASRSSLAKNSGE